MLHKKLNEIDIKMESNKLEVIQVIFKFFKRLFNIIYYIIMTKLSIKFIFKCKKIKKRHKTKVIIKINHYLLVNESLSISH